MRVHLDTIDDTIACKVRRFEIMGQSSHSRQNKMLLKWSVRPRVRAFSFEYFRKLSLLTTRLFRTFE